jgi:hypothetical protein
VSFVLISKGRSVPGRRGRGDSNYTINLEKKFALRHLPVRHVLQLDGRRRVHGARTAPVGDRAGDWGRKGLHHARRLWPLSHGATPGQRSAKRGHLFLLF